MGIAFIVSHIIKNTGSKEFIDLYMKIPTKDCDSETLMYLIDGAREAKITEYYDSVIKMIDIKLRDDLHLSSAIEYFCEVIGESAIDIIGNILDNDCWGRCDPFYCSVGLGNIGNKRAIPYLTRAIDRNKKGRKGWQRELVGYSEDAIKRINDKI